MGIFGNATDAILNAAKRQIDLSFVPQRSKGKLTIRTKNKRNKNNNIYILIKKGRTEYELPKGIHLSTISEIKIE